MASYGAAYPRADVDARDRKDKHILADGRAASDPVRGCADNLVNVAGSLGDNLSLVLHQMLRHGSTRNASVIAKNEHTNIITIS